MINYYIVNKDGDEYLVREQKKEFAAARVNLVVEEKPIEILRNLGTVSAALPISKLIKHFKDKLMSDSEIVEILESDRQEVLFKI